MDQRANLLVSYNEKMDVLADLVRGAASGVLAGVVISGTPGTGKSYVTNKVLSEEFPHKRAVTFKGKVTPFALYQSLYEFRDKRSVVIMDDCDSSFQDVGALNLLKAATDPASDRVVSWVSSAAGVQRFKFEGALIILTNVRLSRSEHYKAFVDRVHTLEIVVTLEEMLAKIVDVAKSQNKVSAKVADELVGFILENRDALDGRVTLRTFLRLAELAQVSKNWRVMAKYTVLRVGTE